MADVAMAPAADMFEMGVQVQVLKRGTFYAQRARKLYELYRTCDSLEDIPASERVVLERDIFRATLTEAWAATALYWRQRDPAQLDRAARDPKHAMALTFRSYLGQSWRWAQRGQVERKADFQVWCGPAMGLFNQWAAGTWLEPLERRDVVDVGLALLWGACVLTRAEYLARCGVQHPALSQLTASVAAALLRRHMTGERNDPLHPAALADGARLN
jgi:PfaD family protein